jgi:hypothetical protein
LWNPINSEPGKISSSALPDDVVYTDDISALSEIEIIKNREQKIYFRYINTEHNITPGDNIT